MVVRLYDQNDLQRKRRPVKVYVNRAPIYAPWGGGALFVNALHEFGDLDMSSYVPDVVLIAGLDADGNKQSAETCVKAAKLQVPSAKLIIRVNECDARKGTTGVDNRLIELSKNVDGTIFVSHWLKDYFDQKGWACKNNTVIHNGVDAEIFKPQSKIDNGKFNIVAHHWSDNPLKGGDIYEEIDRFVGENHDLFTFTYIGRHRCSFKNTKVIPPLFGKALGDELGRYDAYVSASRWDPGPNHITEALSCGLPTWVHKDGGGAVEFAGADHAYATWDELRELLGGADKFRILERNSWMPSSWQVCIAEYNEFMKKVTNGQQA